MNVQQNVLVIFLFLSRRWNIKRYWFLSISSPWSLPANPGLAKYSPWDKFNPLLVFVKFYWNTNMLIHLGIASGCFCVTDRTDSLVGLIKPKRHSLGLYTTCLPTTALNQRKSLGWWHHENTSLAQIHQWLLGGNWGWTLFCIQTVTLQKQSLRITLLIWWKEQ